MSIDFNQPQVVAAIVGGGVAAVVSLAVAVINQFSVRSMHKQRIAADHAVANRKIAADIDLADRKFNFDSDLAERKFRYDREFNDHKRRVELAEEVLADFLQIRQVIQGVRHPGSFSPEGEKRHRASDETEPQAKARNTYFTPLARLEEHSELISTLMAKRYRMNALFGGAVERPFERLYDVLVQIQISARSMIRSITVDGSQDAPPDLWRRWETTIWFGVDEDDPLAAQIETAVSEIESLCRPALTGP
jgi:hypothetical protein